MLILERTPKSSIVINGNIRIEVLRTRSNRVVLGIDAPREVSIVRSELIPAAGKSPVKCKTAPEYSVPPSFRALVVENDPDDAELIRLALTEGRHWSVTLADTGESALRALGGSRPQLVLLDSNVLSATRPGLIHSLRTALPSNEAIIVLSDPSNTADANDRLSAGADAWVAREGGTDSFTRSILHIADVWGQTGGCV
ncbi:MAG TPA: carbon storage regulator [Phycisphaerae bacterium]|nr:carbon storage regulator [Phycisphaerae bacterium]